ncbi:substrate-binding domain-containing protein [Lacticaseibacillus paracasei]|uniref:substrate-binding domain-containing protein n=1 Tax=Lacticaseibacillus paracasei TaxID=1597 RepID=UPI0021A7AA5D|nr:substrate-binding domain-containing protein [Lacticaseibacillus paracasei]MCT4386183.1 D-ribose ABC transporter substrate-binding protein [Lacticaseibacillus paracasei]
MKQSLKRFLMVAVVATAALFTLTACGGTGLSSKSDSNTKVTKKAPKDLKVGVSLSTLSNPFFVSVRNGIQDLAKKNKTNVQVSDAQNDTAKQNSNIEDLIQKKVDVLIINPVDSSAITPAVKDANDAGIPVITVDRSSDGGKVLTLVASNSTKGGQMAAKYMIEKLGKDAKIAELQGIPGASATRERGKGFDGEADGIKAVKAGDMAATVAQKPEEMGRLALQAAYDHFDGKTVKKNVESPLSLVTTEDANK